MRTQPIVKAALSTARPGSHSFATLQPLALKMPKLLRRFPCYSAGPLEKRDLQPPSLSMYISTHMQMEKMDFSPHRQPEFCQVLRMSSLL